MGENLKQLLEVAYLPHGPLAPETAKPAQTTLSLAIVGL